MRFCTDFIRVYMILCDLIRILYDFVCCENGMREWNVGVVCVLFSYLGKVRANARTLPKRFKLGYSATLRKRWLRHLGCQKL